MCSDKSQIICMMRRSQELKAPQQPLSMWARRRHLTLSELQSPARQSFTCFCDEVGCELGSYGLPALRLAVCSRVPVVGDDSCDGPGAGALAGVDHHQQLHEVVIHRRAAGLHQEDITATNGLLHNGESSLKMQSRQPRGRTKTMIQILCNSSTSSARLTTASQEV